MKIFLKSALTIVSVILLLIVFPKMVKAADNYRPIPTERASLPTANKEIIVGFKEPPKTKNLISLSRQKKIVVKNGLSSTKAMVFSIGDKNINETLTDVKKDPNVAYAYPNYRFNLLNIPNDPGIIAMPTPGEPRLQWNMFNMKLAGTGKSAWDVSTGSESVNVAVIDGSFDSTHTDLTGKITKLADCAKATCTQVLSFSNNENNFMGTYHGTHVAGLVAAGTNNSKGIASSGYNTKITVIRLMDDNGDMNISYLINAIRWAADQGNRIVNVSLGQMQENLDSVAISELNAAASYAWGKNTLVVAAAGNCGNSVNPHLPGVTPAPDEIDACDQVDDNGNFVKHVVNPIMYPANSPNVLSVAALKEDNTLASYSAHGSWVSVSAPGGECDPDADLYNCILSTVPPDENDYQYGYLSGTSQASPLVSGLASLLLSVKPALSNSQLKSYIESTANKSIASGSTKNGAVDALAALEALNGATGTPVKTPTPTLSPYPTTGVAKLPKQPPVPYPSAPYCPVLGNCLKKNTGDANCDGLINTSDYTIWKQQFDKMVSVTPVNQNANFSCVEGNNSSYFIDLQDFEIWRKNKSP